MPSRRRRTYESPLRAEQVDRTREKLIEAGVDLVVSEGGEELTVRRVAARANVSVPTAYRYFPDRDSLIDGLAQWIGSRIVGPVFPATVEDLQAYVRTIFVNFELNDRLMRAQLRTPAGRAIRTKHRKARNVQTMETAKRSFPSLSAAGQRRIAGLMRALMNLHTWVDFHDDWGMSGPEAAEVVAWAVQVLVAEVRKRPAGIDFVLPSQR